MKSVQRDFIPYEQALELKELGFDEPCFGKIYADGGSEQLSYPYKNSDQIGKVTSCSAPLYQQVFRWFKEKYDLKEDYGIFPHHTIMFNYILNGGNKENAELECVKELIEIAKLKKW
jgi:hypothetical protein